VTAVTSHADIGPCVLLARTLSTLHRCSAACNEALEAKDVAPQLGSSRIIMSSSARIGQADGRSRGEVGRCCCRQQATAGEVTASGSCYFV
jgi:hypothetical protein